MQSDIATLESIAKHILDNNKDAVKRNLMNLGLVDASFVPDYDGFLNVVVGYEKQHNANAQQLADLTARALDVPINNRGFGASWLVMLESINATKLNAIVQQTAAVTFAAAEHAVGGHKPQGITVSNQNEYRNQVIVWLVLSLLVLAAIGGLAVVFRGMFKVIKSS